MSDPDHPASAAPARRSLFVDTTPLRESPPFARLWGGNAIAGIGSQITVVAVGLQIYDITHSTLAVSFVALFALGPMVVFGIYGGMLADVFDRRKVALISALVAWAATAGICALAWLHNETVWPLYVLTMLNTVGATVFASADTAITPRLLRKELLPAAAALNGISAAISITVGPAVAGVLVAAVGFAPTFSIDVVTFTCAFLAVLLLPPVVPEPGAERPGLRSLIEGARFLRRAANIRTSFIADIIAMTFGQPRVLLPAVGALLIGGGAVTVGVLTAGYAIGGLISSVFSGPLGHVRAQGRAVGRAITVYGAAILAFGVVLLVQSLDGHGRVSQHWGDVHWPSLIAAAAALLVAGGADNVSAIFRGTILQASAPDAMRGRIQSVFIVVVTAGPRVGDLYIGAVSAIWVALWPGPVAGGVLIVVLIFVLMRTQRSFREYDALHPVA
ncbi:MFS transporter [Gryllotalpicola protaetiae]|uniref:MFS transporter n=1 Tax=Gryllotalpicola protaetiae TaxID=2419771 RepID=A0A387BPU6_9MICO|nr:MFS transporter [Gryllotalpicola protaetiae]AYG04512.1 MFS transporter [Gryllotalpicola protaetiae]